MTGSAPLGGDPAPLSPLAEAFPRAAELISRATQRRLTLAVAESCTGGLLGAALSAPAGSSSAFLGGIIAYSNTIKEDLLGVPRDLITSHGAVSAEVARAMAEGARLRLHSHLAVGITGVAGPGGSEAKPPGLIYVAVAGADGAATLTQDRGRHLNRVFATRVAIELLLSEIT